MMKARPVTVEVVVAPVVEKPPEAKKEPYKPQSAFVWPDIDLVPLRRRKKPENPNQMLLFADA